MVINVRGNMMMTRDVLLTELNRPEMKFEETTLSYCKAALIRINSGGAFVAYPQEEQFSNVTPIRFPHFSYIQYKQYLRERIDSDYVKNNIIEYADTYDRLDDEESKEVFREILRTLSTHDVWRLPEGDMENKYWELYKHLDNECFVNCGSANGDTILKYIIKGYRFNHIYGFEGDRKTFKLLEKNISKLPNDLRNRISVYNEYIGIGEKSDDRFDIKFSTKHVSLLNMDIEGAEMGVLNGARHVIKRDRPVLAICAYHRITDLVDIPRLIDETSKDYSIFLRMYKGMTPEMINEYIYYVIPNERLLI